MKVGIVIGRFSYDHIAHQWLRQTAAEGADKVIVLIGSADARRSMKNPFTFDERYMFIRENIINNEFYAHKNFVIEGIKDFPYDDNEWKQGVLEAVNKHTEEGDEIILFGHNKDSSTYYLNMFPEWKFQETGAKYDIDATRMRQSWFSGGQVVMSRMPKDSTIEMINFLDRWKFNESLHQEWEYYTVREPNTYKNYPYKDSLQFNCADFVLRIGDYVLFIIRGRAPGMGCPALPGGFKNNNETFLIAAIRELFEETGIEIDIEFLKKHIKFTQLFDDPKRSLGIPRVTVAVYCHIPMEEDGFPSVNPADDAADYRWIHINNLSKEIGIYDDHKHIVAEVIKTANKQAN